MAETFTWLMTTPDHSCTGPKTKRKTAKWRDQDMVRVDGIPLLYTIDDEDTMLVVLPGGIKMPIDQLTMMGHQVTRPRHIRQKEFL